MSKLYITTAIDYVNGAPHMGHAFEKIYTDAIARGHRMLGYDVRFQTGTDEHGTKIYQSAKEKTEFKFRCFCADFRQSQTLAERASHLE